MSRFCVAKYEVRWLAHMLGNRQASVGRVIKVHSGHKIILKIEPCGIQNVLVIVATLTLGARVGLLSQQTVSKSQGNGKRTQPITP